jgi:hypothetical protein
MGFHRNLNLVDMAVYKQLDMMGHSFEPVIPLGVGAAVEYLSAVEQACLSAVALAYLWATVLVCLLAAVSAYSSVGQVYLSGEWPTIQLQLRELPA